jgi:Flp pilus assembly protein TadB
MLLTSRFVEEMAAAVRGGRSLAASVLVACEACDGAGNGRAPTPSNHDGKNRDADVVVWREVAARIGAGRSLRGAIDDVFRVGQPLSSDERLILSTIVALDTTGSPAIDAVERVGDALRERAASHEDARTHAQQAFSSAAVLSALPAVFGLAAALAEPDLAALYTQRWIGALCVGVAVGLTVAGWEWLQYLLGGRR